MVMNNHNYSAMLIVAGHVDYACVFSSVTVDNNITACQEGFCGMTIIVMNFAAQAKTVIHADSSRSCGLRLCVLISNC